MSTISRLHLAVATTLIGAVALIYGQTAGHEFVRWDDDGYITGNWRVTQGLTWDNLLWAFSTFSMSNWHPLAWLSMMADVSLFGLWAGGHHLMGAAWHAASAMLFYLALQRLTGDAPRSALVALLLAVHPLHVESVAWAAERKDLVCAAFWGLTLLAYAAYAAAPSPRRYAAVAASLACALMAKPMAVSLPLVLLALDVWPLARHRRVPLYRLVLEKVPLALLALGAAVLTLLAQRGSGSTRSLEQVGIAERIENVVTAYATYIVKTFLPTDLSFFYVFRAPGPAEFAAAALLLAAIAGAVIALRRRAPHVAVGMFWFVVALLPVIGLVRVGDQAWANRYTYLPHVGLFIALVWSLPVPAALPRVARQWVLAGLWAAVLASAGLAAAVETRYWRSTETLFGRALEVDPANYIAWSQLADYLVRERRYDAALDATEEAMRHAPPGSPAIAYAFVTRSRVFLDTGRLAPAEQALNRAASLQPDLPVIHYNRGTLELMRNDNESALPHLERAIRLDPDYSEAHNNLGAALGRLGRLEEALAAHRAAVRANPGNADALYNVGSTLERLGDPQGAALAFEQAAQRGPRHVRARLRAARLAEARGDAPAAQRWAREVLNLEPGNAEAQRLAAGGAGGH